MDTLNLAEMLMIGREMIDRFESHLKSVISQQCAPETDERLRPHSRELAELIAHSYDLGIDESMPDRVRRLLIRCYGVANNPAMEEPAEVKRLVGIVVRESVRWWRAEHALGRWSSGNEHSFWLG